MSMVAVLEEEPVVGKKKGRPGSPAPHAVRLYLPEAAHLALRVEAAKRGLSMSAYAQQIVLNSLGFGAIGSVAAAPPAEPEELEEPRKPRKRGPK